MGLTPLYITIACSNRCHYLKKMLRVQVNCLANNLLTNASFCSLGDSIAQTNSTSFFCLLALNSTAKSFFHIKSLYSKGLSSTHKGVLTYVTAIKISEWTPNEKISQLCCKYIATFPRVILTQVIDLTRILCLCCDIAATILCNDMVLV